MPPENTGGPRAVRLSAAGYSGFHFGIASRHMYTTKDSKPHEMSRRRAVAEARLANGVTGVTEKTPV